MVKKISGNPPPSTTATGDISSAKTTASSKVAATTAVQKTEKSAGVEKTRLRTRVMSAAEREQIFQIVQEEAEKLFGPGGLPESKRKTVEDAVKKAIDSGIVEDEDS